MVFVVDIVQIILDKNMPSSACFSRVTPSIILMFVILNSRNHELSSDIGQLIILYPVIFTVCKVRGVRCCQICWRCDVYCGLYIINKHSAHTKTWLTLCFKNVLLNLPQSWICSRRFWFLKVSR